jgi:hypothetical protein
MWYQAEEVGEKLVPSRSGRKTGTKPKKWEKNWYQAEEVGEKLVASRRSGRKTGTKPKKWEKNLHQCYFAHHKSNKEFPVAKHWTCL